MKKFYLISLFISFFLAFFTKLKTQDVHYSQFFNSCLLENPSNTGLFTGNWRFSNIYRNQWRTISIPFKTIYISFDKNFYIYSENFSFGLTVIDDKSGHLNLKNNKIFLSFSYHKNINYYNLHFGLQGGFVFKQFSQNNITFPSQFDMSIGKFNSNLPNNENSFNFNINYPTLNFGFGIERKTNFFNNYLGFSLFNLNSPNESFLNNNNKLPIKINLQLSTTLKTKYLNITPHIYKSSIRKMNNIIVGIKFDKYTKSTTFKEISFGLFNRNDYQTSNDALILFFSVNIKNLYLGFSYDINISELSKISNYYGAIEISLIFISKSLIPNKITIPCEII